MRKWLLVTVFMAGLCAFSGCDFYQGYKERRRQEIESYKRSQIGAILDLDLTDSEIIEYWSNYGGMSDGNALTVFCLSENALSQLYAVVAEQETNKKVIWHALPFSERSYDCVYGGYGWFTDWRDNTNALPYVENGYWWSTCTDESGEVGVSENFDFALFNADMGVLYYYEYDS